MTSSFKNSKKIWENNITELEFLSKEQKQGIDYLKKSKAQLSKVLDDDLTSVMEKMSPLKLGKGVNNENNLNQQNVPNMVNNGNNNISNNNDPLLSDRDFNNNDQIKKHFSDFSSIISPIGDNKKFHFPFIKK